VVSGTTRNRNGIPSSLLTRSCSGESSPHLSMQEDNIESGDPGP